MMNKMMQNGRVAAVSFCALLSRLFFILTQVVIDYLIPDHEAEAFHLDPVPDPTVLDRAVQFLIGGWSKWDSAYFLHIAQYGYTQAHMFAFFPLFPFMVRFLADCVIAPIQYVLFLHMSLYSRVLLAAVILNVIMFVCAAVFLYHLGVRVLYCERLAFQAALMFCFNPASVFMTAAYTESLFAMMSFAGMLFLECNKLVPSVLLFALSGVVRSNGIVSIGFLMYYLMRKNTRMLTDLKNLMSSKHQNKIQVMCSVICSEFKNILLSVCLCSCFLMMLIPFAMFQMYSFLVICNCTSVRNLLSLSSEDLPVASGEVPVWCRHGTTLPYAAIQSSHWNVGFLRYYELKQVPNFLLALPMVVLCSSAMIDYCKHRWKYVCVLGILETKEIQKERRKSLYFDENQVKGFFSDRSLVYIAHVTSLVIFGVTCMHIQVITRLISSSCPVVYWYAAHLTAGSIHHDADDKQDCDGPHDQDTRGMVCHFKNEVLVQLVGWRDHSYSERLLLAYFAGYCILGLCMHCNYLPWT